MLGNGFDLYHTLLTHYDDFMAISEHLYKKYRWPKHFEIKEMKETKELNKSNIYEEISSLASSNETINRKLSLYEKVYRDTQINKDELKTFIEILQKNCWFKYFLDIKSRDGWVALENQVGEVLRKIRDYDESDLKAFQSELTFRGAYYHYNAKEPVNHNICDLESDEIIWECFCEFIELLRLYLKIFVNEAIPNIASTYVFKNDFLRNSDWVITFNYTDTYRCLYDNDVKVTHIHGSIDKEIIVGINSDSYDSPGDFDLRFIKYKKYYQRITKHSFVGLNKLITRLKMTSAEKALYIIGHSLDVADEDLITVIFEWFDKIVIYYLDDESLDKYVKNLKRIFGAKELSKVTFAQKIVFEKLPPNEYVEVQNDQL